MRAMESKGGDLRSTKRKNEHWSSSELAVKC